MCNNGKLLYCIPVEKACLVFGIFNAIVNLLLVMRFALMWFLVLVLAEPGALFKFGGYYYRDWIPEVFLCVIVPLVAMLNFIFSVLLCNGICQSLPKQVKAFLVYGIVVTIPAFLVSVMLLTCDSEQLGLHSYYDQVADLQFKIAHGLAMLFGCVLHSLFLVLVHHTHKKLQKDAQNLDRINLIEYGNVLKDSDTKQRF